MWDRWFGGLQLNGKTVDFALFRGVVQWLCVLTVLANDCVCDGLFSDVNTLTSVSVLRVYGWICLNSNSDLKNWLVDDLAEWLRR